MVLFMPFGVKVCARPMRYCSLARRTFSPLSLSFSNCVTVRSLVACSGLHKCSATPDLSTFLMIMSRLCSLNLSFSCLLDCPMYWQFLCLLVKQHLH